MNTSKLSGRAAMQSLRGYPHVLARPLALCFAFEPADRQFAAASLIELGFTLDTALLTPSESLLAMIRLQWWIESLESTAAETAPLVQNLRISCEQQPDMRDRLIDLIGCWQNACHDEKRDSQPGWQALWRLLGETFLVAPDQAAAAGKFAMSSDDATASGFTDRSNLLALRSMANGAPSHWLYLLACFGAYRRLKNQPDPQRDESAMLGWHLLLWRLGRPPRLG
jgi:hypothetical protein